MSTPEVQAESDIYSFRCIERALRALGPTFVYWWLRQDDQGKMLEQPGSIQLFRELPLSFYQQMAQVNLAALVDLFSWQRGVYPVDVVFTSRAGVAPLISLALADQAGQYPVPVVITEPRVYGPGEVGHNQVHPQQLALRAAGYASCFGVYWSKGELAAALLAAAQYVSPGVLKAAEERAFVVDALVDTDGLEGHLGTRPATPTRLLFAGRLNTNKRYREILEAYGKVVMTRRDVEVWAHAGTGAFRKLDPKEHRWHVTSERLPPEAYWRLLASSHVGAYLSRDEGANVTVQEMLAAGMVLALPDRPWVERLFAPLQYPYRVSSPKALPALLDYLIDHREEAEATLQPIRALIRQERSWPAFLGKFQAPLEAVRAVPRPPAYRTFRKVVDTLLRPTGRVSFGAALRAVPGWQTGMPQFSEARGILACYRAVADLDDMTSADPVLRRPQGETA